MPRETVHRFYCNDRLANECSPSGDRSYIRRGAHLLAQRTSGGHGTSCLMATDTNGSVIAELDASNFQRACYAPYGHDSSDRQIERPIAFNGEPLDRGTGGYLLGNGYRLYSPALRRFTSPDSMSPFGAGGVNAYAYCAGDPINHVDPSGHFSLSTPLSLFGFAGLIASASTFLAASFVKDEALKARLFKAGVAVGSVGMAAMGAAVLWYRYEQARILRRSPLRGGTTRWTNGARPSQDDPQRLAGDITRSRETGASVREPDHSAARAAPGHTGRSNAPLNRPLANQPPPSYEESIVLATLPSSPPPPYHVAMRARGASASASRPGSPRGGSPADPMTAAGSRIRRTR